MIEEFLCKRDVPFFPGRVTDPQKPAKWAKSKSYFRKSNKIDNDVSSVSHTDVAQELQAYKYFATVNILGLVWELKE